jgi:hypothetical protein
MFSSLLHGAGTSPAVQTELLRHGDISTSMNIYTQAMTPAKREAVHQVAVVVLGAGSMKWYSMKFGYSSK